jgi:hypothetical protein
MSRPSDRVYKFMKTKGYGPLDRICDSFGPLQRSPPLSPTNMQPWSPKLVRGGSKAYKISYVYDQLMGMLDFHTNLLWFLWAGRTALLILRSYS